MQLTQLRHMVGLAEQGSFSKAARSLFITQPALSRSIQALEKELGLALFDRVGHRIELTAFGRDVLERARRMLDDARDLAELGARQRDGIGGRLRVGLGSGPGALLTRPLLGQLAARQRSVSLEIARAGTDLLLQRLRARSLDALVVDLLSVVPAPDLEIDLVVELRGAFLCRAAHPLARRRRVGIDDVLAYPVASTPLSDEVARLLVHRYGPRAHPDHLVTLRGDELPGLVDVALHSDAIVLAVQAAAPQLHELALDPPLRARARFGLVTLAGRSAAPALALLRQAVRDHLHD